MEKGQRFWQTFGRELDMGGQPLPGVPLVELAGDRRVLIENHRGVLEYSDRRIGVRVGFGCVLIQGQELCLGKMTRQSLVIHGQIHSVSLERRG